MPRRTLLPFTLAAALGITAAPARAQDDDEGVLARVGTFKVVEVGYFTRLVHGDVMIGSQINEPYVVRADAPNVFGLGTQWEALAVAGALARWNPTREPLTYYHRTGPVGAVFHHLRTRKAGADAAAPVGVIGLNIGTIAAYARRGQAVTFYEPHTELKGLVADTERHFTHIQDARRRGAKVETKFGPTRKTLAADADRRFAVLFVEMIENGFDPGDRLTLDAVRLYFDRVTPDGLVALHISNKDYHLEPVTERIGRELGLVGRVWNDDSESRPGKTASSWVVFARSEAVLGPLARPLVEQVVTYGTRNEELVRLLRLHPPTKNAMEAILEQYGGPPPFWPQLTPTLMSICQGHQAAMLYQYAIRFREVGRADADLGRLAEVVFGRMFRPLQADARVELRTDARRPTLPAPPAPTKK
ncbi:MAG TPA: hypothetical protein VH092_02665 [Urbifossiella sp.]|nr:hypothetical protein [Urbifossiella sp.]